MKTQPTGYWTFFCNPIKFEIDKCWDKDTDEDFYHVTKWQKDWFHQGQLGVIRVGNDYRKKDDLLNNQRLKPGIYAIVEVLGEAYEIKEENEIKYAVDLRILKNLLYNPLLKEYFKNDVIIEMDNYLVKGYEASSMPLNKQVYERIIELIHEEDNNLKEIEKSVEKEPVSNPEEIINLENKFINAKPKIKEIISKRIERGPLSQKIKIITNFKCLICDKLGKEFYSFKKKNGEPYIEAHHVIPVSEQKIGTLALSNIITVCANHHRQLHYGNVKCEIYDKKIIFKIDGNVVEIDKFRLPENL